MFKLYTLTLLDRACLRLFNPSLKPQESHSIGINDALIPQQYKIDFTYYPISLN